LGAVLFVLMAHLTNLSGHSSTPVKVSGSLPTLLLTGSVLGALIGVMMIGGGILWLVGESLSRMSEGGALASDERTS